MRIHVEHWSGGIPGYGDALPTGQLAIYNPSKGVIVTHDAQIALPALRPAYFVVLAHDGFRIAATVQLGRVDHAFEWNGRTWTDYGPCCGANAVIYDQNDRLVIAQCDHPTYSLGYRCLGPNGELVTGASTYADSARGLYEYTDFGDVAIGQGDDAVGEGAVVRFADDGIVRRLETGAVRRIKVRRSVDLFAITTVNLSLGETSVYRLTLSELRGLPPVASKPVPPPIPVPEPTPMPDISKYLIDRTEVVYAVKADYPHLKGGQIVDQVAHRLNREHGVTLFGRKARQADGGNPNEDVLTVQRDPADYSRKAMIDILRDGGGLDEPTWSVIPEHEEAGNGYWRPPVAADLDGATPQPPPVPPPTPGPIPPPPDTELRKRVDALEARLQRLETAGLLVAQVYRP